MEEVQKVRYQAAIQMIVYEGQVIWRTFAAMVAANGFVVAVATFMKASSIVDRIGKGIVGIGGLAICVFWLLGSGRQWEYQTYWFACAKQAEESKDGLFTQGAALFAGGFRVRWLMNAVIAAFALLYVFLFMSSL